jgi:hypothetical protein
MARGQPQPGNREKWFMMGTRSVQIGLLMLTWGGLVVGEEEEKVRG